LRIPVSLIGSQSSEPREFLTRGRDGGWWGLSPFQRPSMDAWCSNTTTTLLPFLFFPFLSFSAPSMPNDQPLLWNQATALLLSTSTHPSLPHTSLFPHPALADSSRHRRDQWSWPRT
jgi:hypothetical protein